MTKKNSDSIVTDDEFQLLSEIVVSIDASEEEEQHIAFDISGSNGKEELLFQLGLSDELQLVANYGNHRLVFPIGMNEGDFSNFNITFKPPKIFEKGASLRPWRLLGDKNIYLINQQGEVLNYHIKDLSVSGISLLIDHEGQGDLPEQLNNIYLQLPNNERLAISATKIRRVDDKTAAYSLESSLDDTVLAEYLLECHALQYPEVYQTHDMLKFI